jgi:LacI family transcriptional regulator, galactose operon repressor
MRHSTLPQNYHVTIREVAKVAGVSTTTVSHAFNLTGRITPETRRRVLAIARELKYYPNRNAQSLAARSSRTLGVIVSDIENPFFAVAIRSFGPRAQHWGYDIVVKETEYKISLMRRAAERMLEQKVRGVAILTSEMSPAWLKEIVRQNIPVTCFDLDFVNERATNLKVDYLSSIRQVIDHLYQLGRRRMAFVGGRRIFRNILSRQESYVTTMRQLGLEPGPVIIGNQRIEGGYLAGIALLESSPRPTAVVAMNDLTAMGLIRPSPIKGFASPKTSRSRVSTTLTWQNTTCLGLRQSTCTPMSWHSGPKSVRAGNRMLNEVGKRSLVIPSLLLPS